MQKTPLTAPVKNRFGVSLASAVNISLKNAKNSPALEQFHIFAALRATARHTPEVFSTPRGGLPPQKILRFSGDPGLTGAGNVQ